MMKRWIPIILINLFLISLIIGLVGLFQIKPIFKLQDRLTFTGADGDRLAATYFPGTKPIGVLMLEGFGSDQIALRPAASVFLNAGAHVFIFDFSGHGRSSGALGFDNAATDRLAYQALAAKETFKTISGLVDDQIIYFGHSLGARVALQSASLDPSPPKALVLLGTQINLGTNIQSEFFTGTSDAELDWVQSLSAQEPETDIFLLSGTWDDILTPQAAQALFDQLTSDQAQPGSSYTRTLTLVPGLVHNYEIYSTVLLHRMGDQLESQEILDFPGQISLARYYASWGLVLFGLIGALITAPKALERVRPIPTRPPLSTRITRLRRFFIGKLLLWLGAIPAAALLMGLFFLLPLDLPVFNLIYVGFIGGYGLLMLVLYLIGKAPGTDGKWRLKMEHHPSHFSLTQIDFWLGGLLWAVIMAVCVTLAGSGFYDVILLNQRIIWLIIFTPVTALGFWIAERESIMHAGDLPSRVRPKAPLGTLPIIIDRADPILPLFHLDGCPRVDFRDARWGSGLIDPRPCPAVWQTAQTLHLPALDHRRVAGDHALRIHPAPGCAFPILMLCTRTGLFKHEFIAPLNLSIWSIT